MSTAFRAAQREKSAFSLPVTPLQCDYIYQHYLKIITKIETKQEVLTRKYYTDTKTTSHYQISLRTQFLEELLQALHCHNSNHPGITKMIQEGRQNHSNPRMAKNIENGLGTAKLAYKPKGSKPIISGLNCSFSQNVILALKTFFK